MHDPNWQQAKATVIERLAEVRQLIDQKDESAVLAMINQQDAFCDAAKERRSVEHSGSTENHCHFCEGNRQAGGCSGMIAEIDRAVLKGQWQVAAKLVDDYRIWVEKLVVTK